MSRNKKESYKEHHLLDQDCREYMEAAIKEYHKIGSDFVNHYEFLLFWYKRLQEKPTPQNAMLCAFRFNENISDKQKIVAEKYFQKLITYYNKLPSCNTNKPDKISIEEWENSLTIKKYNEAKGISQWIKSYRSSNPLDYIVTNDINWTPDIEENKWSKREKLIAQQCSFSWSIARLWQLLCNRKKPQYMNNFLVFTVGENSNSTKAISESTLEKDLSDLKGSLKNLNPEDISFFEKYLHLFDPAYLTNRELCTFWKKACICSINGKPLTGTIRQPLDKIWLLARFFGVHLYDIDFIDAERGLSPRLVKQIETLINPDSLTKACHQKVLNLCKKKNPRWGNKGLPVEEILLSLCSEKDLEEIRKKAKEKFSDFQENPEQELSKKIDENKSHSSILNSISFLENRNDSPRKKEAKQKILTKIQENRTSAIKIFLYIAMIDYFYTNFFSVDCPDDDFDDEEVDEIEKICSTSGKDVTKNNDIQDENNPGLIFHCISASISWSLMHEKNFFLISNDDIDKSFWESMGSFLSLVFLTIAIIKFSQSFNTEKASKPSNS